MVVYQFFAKIILPRRTLQIISSMVPVIPFWVSSFSFRVPLYLLKYAYNPPNLYFSTRFWGIITMFSRKILLTLHLKIRYILMIIGRKSEQKELLDAANAEYSKFVAVYGRRRVGKTFLIRETFNYSFTLSLIHI